MISDQQAIKDLKNITGTRNIESVDLKEWELGLHRATLLKVDLSRLNQDGWGIKIDKIDEMKNAFYSGDLKIPYGEVKENFVYINPPLSGYAWMNDDGQSWTFQLKEDFTGVQVGQKVVRMGNSTVILSNEKIEIRNGQSLITLSNDEVSIALVEAGGDGVNIGSGDSEIELSDTEININSEEVYVDGAKLQL
jgi:hypothetical protein